MPQGSRHRLTGLLLEGKHDPVLRVDDGGEWRLELDRPDHALLGRRVVVDGVRRGFDLLAVERIWLHGAPEPPKRVSVRARITRLLGR